MSAALIGWFGIRGIGSIYYLMYAIDHGLPPDLARPLVALTLTTVAVSIVVHGISVTPLMNRYRSQDEEEAAGIEGLRASLGRVYVALDLPSAEPSGLAPSFVQPLFNVGPMA